MQEKEIWKDIPGYEGLYQVNKWGDIFSLYTNKILKYSTTKDGYKQYNLHKNKKAYVIFAHKAVALAFIPNPDNLPCVNHKDEDKQNNFFENLEWCTVAYNNNYSNNGKKGGEKTSKKVYCYNLDGTLYKIYKSSREAARDLNASSGNISCAAKWRECEAGRKSTLTVKNKVFSLKERTKEEVLQRVECSKNRGIFYKNNKFSKKVEQLKEDGSVLNLYPSVEEAGRITGIAPRQISRAARLFEKGATCHGYKWKYVE